MIVAQTPPLVKGKGGIPTKSGDNILQILYKLGVFKEWRIVI